MVALRISLNRASCLTQRIPSFRIRPLSGSSSWQNVAAQPDPPASDKIELSAPAAYVSLSHDPWFNLSYEDWLLRNTPRDQPVLFLYRNIPCVVLGRNQNPWKETTPKHLREDSIPLVRRRSGGGTVYHDMGNTNFSIMLPRLLFTRNHGAELVAKAVRERLGVEQCTVNERNDVILRDGERDLKVSGSAYKIIQHRAYHHGTMLISSSVAELGKALHSNALQLETKGVASFRSPVTNLNTYLPSSKSALKHADFVNAVVAEFGEVYGSTGCKLQLKEVTESSVKEEKVWQGVQELKSWEWVYGQTPEFTNLLQGEISKGRLSVTLSSRHALITSIRLRLEPGVGCPPEQAASTQEFLDALALSLLGKRYETLDAIEGTLSGRYDEPDWRSLGTEVIGWLRKNM